MPAIENPMSSADQNPDMSSITIHDSRLNLSVMDVQKLARMEHQRNASIYFVQKSEGGLWRQVHLDEVRTTKCLELLKQLAMELSPPTEEVSINGLQREKDQSEAKFAIKHPEEFDPKSEFNSSSSILLPVLARSPKYKVLGDWTMITSTSWLSSSKLSSSNRVAQSKLSKAVPPPFCMNLVLRPKIVRPISTPISLQLGWSLPKHVLSEPHTNIVLRPKLALSDSLPVLGSDLISAKFIFPSAFTDLVYRPKAVFPTSKPTIQSKPAKLLLPPSGLAAIQEKMAAQVKVCGEKEVRIKEVSGRTSMRHGPWVKAMKKAGQSLKIERKKLKKLRREEKNLAGIGKLEKIK